MLGPKRRKVHPASSFQDTPTHATSRRVALALWGLPICRHPQGSTQWQSASLITALAFPQKHVRRFEYDGGRGQAAFHFRRDVDVAALQRDFSRLGVGRRAEVAAFHEFALFGVLELPGLELPAAELRKALELPIAPWTRVVKNLSSTRIYFAEHPASLFTDGACYQTFRTLSEEGSVVLRGERFRSRTLFVADEDLAWDRETAHDSEPRDHHSHDAPTTTDAACSHSCDLATAERVLIKQQQEFIHSLQNELAVERKERLETLVRVKRLEAHIIVRSEQDREQSQLTAQLTALSAFVQNLVTEARTAHRRSPANNQDQREEIKRLQNELDRKDREVIAGKIRNQTLGENLVAKVQLIDGLRKSITTQNDEIQRLCAELGRVDVSLVAAAKEVLSLGEDLEVGRQINEELQAKNLTQRREIQLFLIERRRFIEERAAVRSGVEELQAVRRDLLEELKINGDLKNKVLVRSAIESFITRLQWGCQRRSATSKRVQLTCDCASCQAKLAHVFKLEQNAFRKITSSADVRSCGLKLAHAFQSLSQSFHLSEPGAHVVSLEGFDARDRPTFAGLLNCLGWPIDSTTL
ncbi:hypothetical protein HKX48_002284 [Thoreauomyces humboldtii]|nr:hypothetical protein HKX48_002284 [Thoreauomyces humboldtii]